MSEEKPELVKVLQNKKTSRRRLVKSLIIGLGASIIVQPNGGIMGQDEDPKVEKKKKSNKKNKQKESEPAKESGNQNTSKRSKRKKTRKGPEKNLKE